MLGVALRVTIAYVYVLALMRLSGKQSLGTIAPWDFLVALIVGDLFDDLFWGEIPVATALVGLTTIMGLHVLVSYAAYKSIALDRLLGSGPVPVVRGGRFARDGLRRERLREEIVWSQMRIKGVDRLADVKEAVREPNGQTSVLKREEAKPADGRDLAGLKEAA